MEKKYYTIKIGEQVWMAQNLNYDGTKDDGVKKMCHKAPAFGKNHCDVYGGLYTWTSAIKACPIGWHLPSEDEWKILFEEVGGIDDAKTKLLIRNRTLGGLDSYGFSATCGGCIQSRACPSPLDIGAHYWTSTEKNADNAIVIEMLQGHRCAFISTKQKFGGFSIRCIRDK